jgi:hypothetical protein
MLARLAMAVDCEGSILLCKYNDIRRYTGVRYYIQVNIYNTNEEFIDWMVDNFGFSKWSGAKRTKPNHKQEHLAYLSRAKAEEILWGVRPYLIIKSALAELALDLQDTMQYNRGKSKVPDNILAERERLWLAAKELNRKGRYPELISG